MAGGSRYDGTALGPNGRGPIPHATIAVLTQPANTSTTPGSPLATIYTDATLGTTTANPFQADVLGNFHFYADATLGPFTIQVYGPQVQTPYVLADQAIVDPTGIRNADSFASLQAAITAAAGTALNVTPGKVYTVSATLTIPSNTTIHWNGATLKAGNALNADVMFLSGVTGVHFIGPLTFDGNKANQTLPLGNCLTLNANSNDNTFDTLIFQNAMDSALQLSNGSSRNRFGKVYVTNPGGAGININSQGSAIVLIANANNNQFEEIYTSGAQGGRHVQIAGCSKNQFNTLYMSGGLFKGLEMITSSSVPATYNTFANVIADGVGIGSPNPLGTAGIILTDSGCNFNVFGNLLLVGCMNNGLEVTSGSYNTFASVLADSTVYAGTVGAGGGIFVGGFYNAFGSVVTRNNACDGLRIDSGSHNTFASVVSINNSQQTLNTYDGVSIFCVVAPATDNLIVSLRSGNTGATGQKYGFHENTGVGGTPSANQILAADLTNNQTAASLLLTPPGTAITTQKNGSFAPQRIASNGTPVVAGDFVPSAGWGNTATVTGVVGTDQAWTITVTANGAGIGASPFITLTFHDGTWTNAPIAISKMIGGTGTVTPLTDTTSGAQWIVTFNGTPVAASTYIISGIAMGR